MKQNKKGISPLIATVLLIGFAVTIALLVWFWYGGLVKGNIEKLGAENDAKIVCASKVSYSIKNICQQDDQIIIRIENKGSDINSFKVSLTGTNSIIDTKDVGTMIIKSETKEINAFINATKIGNTVSRVTVIPVIERQGVSYNCEEKKQESTKINTCT